MNRTKKTAALLLLAGAGLTVAACTSTSTPLQPAGNTPSNSYTTPPAQAPAPPPPPSTPPSPTDAPVLLDYSGSGTAVTPKFKSISGNYVVSWSYSGNSDQYGPSNFIMEEDGGNDFNSLGLPNDIQASGHGSTSVTNDPGTHNFNVQAASGSRWTVKVDSE